MPQALGAKGQLIVQKEATFKTTPTPDANLLYFITESVRQARPNISSNVITGSRNPTKPVRGNVDVSGSITTEMQAYFLTMLEATFGDVATTGTDPYVHTFTIGDALPSLVIEKGFTDNGDFFLYNGCVVSAMNLDINADGGFQEISWDIIGAKETTDTSSFDGTPTDLGKQSFDDLAVATIEEGGGAPSACVTSISGLSIVNDLDDSIYCIGGAGERSSVPAGIVKVTGTLTALFASMALYDKAVASTETSLKIVWSLGTADGSAGNEYFEILIPELIYSPNAPVISGPRGVLVELPFEAYYDDSSEASAIQVIVKNTQATIT